VDKIDVGRVRGVEGVGLDDESDTMCYRTQRTETHIGSRI
jgi:hypothetical protein